MAILGIVLFIQYLDFLPNLMIFLLFLRLFSSPGLCKLLSVHMAVLIQACTVYSYT